MAPMPDPSKADQESRCAVCDAVLPTSKTKPRRYCSSACRQKGWRNRIVTNPSDNGCSVGILHPSAADSPHGAVPLESQSCGTTTSMRAP